MESTGRGSDVSYLMVTFDQIYSELGNVYDPSANLYQQQIDAIPTQTAAAVSQADAKKDLAYEQITNSARQRGMGFSGIPLAEQAKYNATEYAPAIANLKSNAEANRVSLLEAMNSLNRDRRTQAQSIYDNNMSRDLAERQFQESIRQFNEQLAANKAASAAANVGQYLPGNGGSNGNGNGNATMNQKADGGFAFVVNGTPVSAATYAMATGQSFRSLLQKMANNGDKGAKAALNFVGDDYGYDPNKIGNNASLYNALVWGSGKQAYTPTYVNGNLQNAAGVSKAAGVTRSAGV